MTATENRLYPLATPVNAPEYESEAYHQAQARLKELEATRRAMWAEERIVDAAVNRSKRTTPKGLAAKDAQVEFRSRMEAVAAEIGYITASLKLSFLLKQRSEALDELNQDGLDCKIHHLRYEVKTPEYWSVWTPEIQEERGRLHRRFEYWRDLPYDLCPADFNETMKENVGKHVEWYVSYKCDNSMTYEQVVQEGIDKQIRIRKQNEERARQEQVDAEARYKALQPIVGLSVRLKAWCGTDAQCRNHGWAVDGSMGFHIPETPSKTVEKLLCQVPEKAPYWQGVLKTIEQAQALAKPATILGYLPAAPGTVKGNDQDVVYIETTEGFWGVEAYRLTLLNQIIYPDAYGAFTSDFKIEDRLFNLQTVVLYRNGKVEGFILPLNRIWNISKGEEK